MQPWIFRPTITADIQAIAAIHNANVRDQQCSNRYGFLLTTTTPEEILQRSENGVHYFVAVNAEDDVIGFLSVSKPNISLAFLNQVRWKEDKYQHTIVSDHNVYIQTVATRLDWMGQGVAQFMYRSLYKAFLESFFTTFVVSKPVANHRSIIFHEKQGFQFIGTVHYDRFLDLDNYESRLLLKGNYPGS